MTELQYPRLGERCFADRLPSGLTVYVLPRRGLQNVCMTLAVPFGSNDERFALNGHWRNVPQGTAELMGRLMLRELRGNAPGADASFRSAPDRTLIRLVCHDRQEECLRQLMRTVLKFGTDRQALENEKEHISRGISDPVLDDGDQALRQALYVNHPIREQRGISPHGTSKISAELLTACHRAFCHPSQLVLCVVGDVEPRRITMLAAAESAVLPAVSVERWCCEPEPESSGMQEALTESARVEDNFLMGFKARPVSSLREQLIAELGTELLFGAGHSLCRQLAGDHLISAPMRCAVHTGRDFTYLSCASRSADPAAVADIVLGEGVRVAWNGLDQETFQRTVRQVYGQHLRRLDRPSDLARAVVESHDRGEHYLAWADLLADIPRHEVEMFLQDTIAAERSALVIIREKGAV